MWQLLFLARKTHHQSFETSPSEWRWSHIIHWYCTQHTRTYFTHHHNQITSSFCSLTSLLHHIFRNMYSNQSMKNIQKVTFLSTWKTCMGMHCFYYSPLEKILSTALSKTSFLITSINNLFWLASIPHRFSIFLQILSALLSILYFIIHQIHHVKMHPSCPRHLKFIHPSMSTPWTYWY